MTHTVNITVAGMTCAHCVASVSEELQEIAGVSEVQVDLPTGSVSISSDRPLDDTAVRAAVEAAGYRVA